MPSFLSIQKDSPVFHFDISDYPPKETYPVIIESVSEYNGEITELEVDVILTGNYAGPYFQS